MYQKENKFMKIKRRAYPNPIKSNHPSFFTINPTHNIFCEFCTKSFCPECTVKEAHDMNIYEERDEIGCSNIHVSEINEHFEEMVWSTKDCVERASAGLGNFSGGCA